MGDRLKAIRERLEKITPGEWRAERARTVIHIGIPGERRIAEVSVHGGLPAAERAEYAKQAAIDAEFIAACPADILWLASEVERLSRIEAAAVAYREAEEGLSRDRARYTDAACKPLPEQAALFATLPPSSEAVPHA